MTNFIERVRLVDANSSNKICFEVELDLSFSLSIGYGGAGSAWKCSGVLKCWTSAQKGSKVLKVFRGAQRC